MQTKEIKLIDVVSRDWPHRWTYYILALLIVCKVSATLRLWRRDKPSEVV